MIKIQGYKIIEKIGSGGMGDVYLAEHEKLEKKVAIKSLHKNLANDSDFRIRFSQEAKTHSKLDHQNIVKLLDYRERKDGLFLIMEYFDGIQLDEYINKVSGPIPETELTNLFCQILDAIGYAHDEGLIHRDIKPSNIMIDKKGKIKVLDFGIAKLQDEDQGLTKTGVQIGTASYMSPEQVNAEKLDKLSDIYSLGVTLFHMSVGKSPYNAETNSFKIQTQIINNELPKASDIYPGVSRKIEDIITRSTKKNKSLRFQSCIDFKKDLLSSKIESDVNIDKNNIKIKLKEKPKRKSSTIRNIFYLLFISFCVYLYFNPQHIPLSNFQEPAKKEFKVFLTSYYKTLEKHDYEDFNKFYSNRVNKWFNEDDILLEDIIIKSTDYQKKYLFEKHLVKWKTLKIDNLNGKYLLSYEIFYKCKKTGSDEWLKWDVNISMILNEKMKIYSLQETKRNNLDTEQLLKTENNKIIDSDNRFVKKRILLPTKKEIYINKFNKEPDFGDSVDVSSSLFTADVLNSRISEVFDEYSHSRYGKLNEALSYNNKLINDFSYSSLSVLALHLYDRARIRYFMGDYSNAIKDINMAIQHEGDDGNWYWLCIYRELRCKINYMHGNFNEAKYDINKVFFYKNYAKKNIEDQLYILKARIFNALGNFDESCEIFRKCKNTDLSSFYLTQYCNPDLKIGDFFEGGIVFQLDSTKQHGFVCDITDLQQSKWELADSLCSVSFSQGYNDWVLPSKEQLNKMYLKRFFINSTSLNNGGSKFKNDYYWSSIEDNNDSTRAWKINMYTEHNNLSTSEKYFPFRIRAVRAF